MKEEELIKGKIYIHIASNGKYVIVDFCFLDDEKNASWVDGVIYKNLINPKGIFVRSRSTFKKLFKPQ